MSSKSAILLFLPLAFALHAGKRENVVLKQTYQLSLTAQSDGEHLHLSAVPQVLSKLPVPVQGPFLSRHLQTALALHEHNKERWDLIVPFAVSVRALDGHIFDFKTFISTVPGIKPPAKGGLPPLPFEEQFKQLLAPLDQLDLVLPPDQLFLVDIAYNPPRKMGSNNTFKPSFSIRLGVALCRRSGDSILCQSNQQTRLFEQARVELLSTIDNAADQEELVEGLRRYLELVPSDRTIRTMVADTYEKLAPETAHRYVAENQPYFARWFKRDPYNGGGGPTQRSFGLNSLLVRTNQRDPNGEAYQTRKRVRKRLQALPQSEGAWLKILEPVAGDMVSGRTQVSFSLRQPDADNLLLSAFCLVDGVVVAEIDGPPNRFTLELKDKGRHKVQVIACFADETRAEHEIEIDVLPTDESQRIHLSEVQLIALDGKGWPTDLDTSRLSIGKGNLSLPVERVWRDGQPLDLVVLVDTSGSMIWRIYQAQYVVQQFLSKLGAQEAASVFTYDEKVALVKRFENDLDEAAPRMFTLLPQGRTALYDALLVAHSQLEQRQGSTKAIILLGDGVDTASSTRADEVLSLFEGTPIRVFSIQLTGNGKDPFLRDMAKTTGGRYWPLGEHGDPQQALDWILAALRQLNFLTFSNPNESTEDVVFKVPGVQLDALHVRRY